MTKPNVHLASVLIVRRKSRQPSNRSVCCLLVDAEVPFNFETLLGGHHVSTALTRAVSSQHCSRINEAPCRAFRLAQSSEAVAALEKLEQCIAAKLENVIVEEHIMGECRVPRIFCDKDLDCFAPPCKTAATRRTPLLKEEIVLSPFLTLLRAEKLSLTDRGDDEPSRIRQGIRWNEDSAGAADDRAGG